MTDRGRTATSTTFSRAINSCAAQRHMFAELIVVLARTNSVPGEPDIEHNRPAGCQSVRTTEHAARPPRLAAPAVGKGPGWVRIRSWIVFDAHAVANQLRPAGGNNGALGRLAPGLEDHPHRRSRRRRGGDRTWPFTTIECATDRPSRHGSGRRTRRRCPAAADDRTGGTRSRRQRGCSSRPEPSTGKYGQRSPSHRRPVSGALFPVLSAAPTPGPGPDPQSRPDPLLNRSG